MKKITISIMIILLVSVAMFADGVATGDQIGNKSAIFVETKVEEISYFGVSGNALDPIHFQSTAAFAEAVEESMIVPVGIEVLKEKTIVGFISGINNTKNKIILSIEITPLKNLDITTAKPIELTLLVDRNENVEFLTIDSAVNVLGILKSVELMIYGDANAIDQAPAGRYTSNIVFRVKSNS